jgi:hypothetical protein
MSKYSLSCIFVSISHFLTYQFLNTNVEIVYCLVVYKERKGERISWVIISDTTTTDVHSGICHLHSSSYHQFALMGKISVFYMELWINLPFFCYYYKPVVGYLCSNYLLSSKLWRRAAVDCCPEELYHRGSIKFYYNLCCPELYHQCTTPEYYTMASKYYTTKAPKLYTTTYAAPTC